MASSNSQAEDILLNLPQFSLIAVTTLPIPLSSQQTGASTHTSVLSGSALITTPTSFTTSQFSLPSFPSNFTFGDVTTHRPISPTLPTQTIHDLEFSRKLTEQEPPVVSDLLRQIQNFIHADVYVLRKWDLENEVKELHNSKKIETAGYQIKTSYHDKLGPPQKVESLVILEKLAKMLCPPKKRNKPEFCQFHIDHGHEFLIVSVPSPYNCIMGRSTLNQFHARISTADLSMEIPKGAEVYVIYGDQNASKERYFATVKEVEKIEDSIENNSIPKLQPEGEYELFILDNLHPDYTVRIGRNLPMNLRMNLAELLDEYKEIFAWSSSDLGTLPRHIAEHNNNEVEYEALLAGLRMVKSLKLTHILVQSNSQVVIGHVTEFSKVQFEKVPKEQNTRADMLSKLNAGDHIDGTWLESLSKKSIDMDVCMIEEVDNWKNPIQDFILNEKLPDDPYRTMGNWPLLKCVIPEDGRYILREIHEEIGSKSLRNLAFSKYQNEKLMHEHLVLIDELREMATKRNAHYKRQLA
ncbi:hypothetical protein M9H77_27583 [Catharanthus roseus]|uniref:Uncharacterized protein n=1 Tax=Catharanthus roseus TaxID=4058 RepID=A0ACC0AET3_CATRO|nr:hypothetical protein M9H77_27583 [Catharanthus roseus]